MSTVIHRKHRSGAPPGFFTCEAAGLRWLSVPGGPRVVEVLGVDEAGLDLERLTSGNPTAEAAAALGTGLARMHDAGAPAFGAVPPGWQGDGFFGPLAQPFPLLAGAYPRWGRFYAELRVAQVRDLLADRGRLSAGLRTDLDVVAGRLRDGDLDDGAAPARVHGDLWSGNVVWALGRGGDGAGRTEAVLIDPAAHGGHRLADLAMLELFGLPHLDLVLHAYEQAHPLPEGWREVLALHQLYPVGMHAVLFGGGYVDQLRAIVTRYA